MNTANSRTRVQYMGHVIWPENSGGHVY